MSTPTQEQMAAQFQFAQLAAQYYASGRFAALTHCLPVAGNLLHHAVEMFLKCALVRTLTLAELKTLGHKLPVLWTRFRSIHTDQTYATLDEAITELDRFERLRYPDNVVIEGMQVSFVIFKAQFARLPQGPQPPYHLILEDVDLLSQVAARTSGLSAQAFSASSSEHANYFLQLHNAHPI